MDLKELQAQLAKGLEADPATLRKLSDNYVNGDAGLELRAFSDVGKPDPRLRRSCWPPIKTPTPNRAYEKQIDSLAGSLDAAAVKPNEVDRRQLGETIDQLAATGAAPQLVHSLKHQFNQPNVLVRVSKDVVAGGIDDNLNEKTPIEDNILGTQICGTGDTTGRVTSTLVPSRDNAKIELVLKGRTLAHTVGWNGPVTIFAHSTTSLYGRKLLTIDGGTFGGEPACAECCTNSSIDCLDIDGGRLIQRIATKRVYSSKSTAEAISAEHAEGRLENRMDTRTGELIAALQRRLQRAIPQPAGAPRCVPAASRIQHHPRCAQRRRPPGSLQRAGRQHRARQTPPQTPTSRSACTNRSSTTSPPPPCREDRAARWPTAARCAILMAEPYDRAEFLDFVACLAEAAAPADKRDAELVIPYRNFESLMKDRFNMDVTKADYDALAKSLYDAKLTTQAIRQLPVEPCQKIRRRTTHSTAC